MHVCADCGAATRPGEARCANCQTSEKASAFGRTQARFGPVAAAATAAVPADSFPDNRNVTVGDDAPDARVGRTFGSYQLLEVLGEGGMGAVYLAEHTKLGRRVALKMLHPRYASQQDVVRRFFAEAKAVNTIFHENIVEITDFVENEHGQNYFIMEHLKGGHLGQLVASEGPLPLSRSLGIAVQICSALGAVHEAGIVHRDLKPENVFLTERGGQNDFVKVLDFGVAKLLDDSGHTLNVQTTAAGMVLGTPEYMSPEQACGRPVDYRTDIYSFGVMLYELATGRKPFDATTFGEIVVAHSTQAPTPPRELPDLFQDVPRPLEDLILACLAKQPQDRPSSIAEIEEQLREIADTYAMQLERFDLSPPRTSRRTWLIASGVAAVLAAVAVVGFGATTADEPVVEPVVAVEPTPEPAAVVAPPPPDAAVPKVRVRFRSRPGGAEVYAEGSDEPLGVTPFAIEVAGGAEQPFEFRKDGFESFVERVDLSSDTQVRVVLAREPKPRDDDRAERRRRRADRAKPTRADKKPVRRTPKRKRIQEGAVMNPFDD